MSTTVFVSLLSLLVVPYIGLMLLVFVGMLRRPQRRSSAERPSVSVVIPAHNEEDVLGATLASLAEQRYPGSIEFVVVDDRSKDATAKIVRDYTEGDARFRLVQVTESSRRLAPKVNAVNEGIAGSTGDIIVTSDADCIYPNGWVEGMVDHFAPGVAMVVGYVEASRSGEPLTFRRRFESCDWLTLMMTSRSLLRFGYAFASSANNQAYRRTAFEAASGFGVAGRAPSGDEDLLVQRLARHGEVVFAETPETRVLTRPMPSWLALLRQRRRWVSRYHHPMQYKPAFFAGIALLGAQSLALAIALLLLPLWPALIPWVLGLWALKLIVELVTMQLGTRQFARPDLWPLSTLGWALLHPFFIGFVSVWSLLRPGAWHAGASGYRRRYLQRLWRTFKRKVRAVLLDT
jgi:cellulose synthase/poly-beta-1,6-N-acetylglucosamine synthase-like glycosyltransferase